MTSQLESMVRRMPESKGIADTRTLSRKGSPNFGDVEIVLQCGTLLLQVISDQGQVFVDLASAPAPEDFLELGSVDITSSEDCANSVSDPNDVRTLNSLLDQLTKGWDALQASTSQEQLRAILERDITERNAVD